MERTKAIRAVQLPGAAHNKKRTRFLQLDGLVLHETAPLRKSRCRQLKGLIDYNEITLAAKVFALTHKVIREFPIKIPVLYKNLMSG